MPVASLLHDRFLASVNKGRGELDWSAVALAISEDGGVRVPQQQPQQPSPKRPARKRKDGRVGKAV